VGEEGDVLSGSIYREEREEREERERRERERERER
jgi:hypothetical protein